MYQVGPGMRYHIMTQTLRENISMSNVHGRGYYSMDEGNDCSKLCSSVTFGLGHNFHCPAHPTRNLVSTFCN